MYLPSGDHVGIPVLTRTFGDLDRVTTADLLKPDIGLSAAIGTVGDGAAIGRPSGTNLEAVVKSQAGQRALEGQSLQAGMPFLVNEPSCTC